MSKIISGEKKIELGTILLDGKVIMKDVIVITFPVGLGRSGFAPKYMVPKRARLSLTFVGDGGDRPIDLDIKAIGQIVTNSFGLPSHYSVNLKGTEVISNIECNIYIDINIKEEVSIHGVVGTKKLEKQSVSLNLVDILQVLKTVL